MEHFVTKYEIFLKIVWKITAVCGQNTKNKHNVMLVSPENKQNVSFFFLLVPDCRLLQRSNHEGHVRNKSAASDYLTNIPAQYLVLLVPLVSHCSLTALTALTQTRRQRLITQSHSEKTERVIMVLFLSPTLIKECWTG